MKTPTIALAVALAGCVPIQTAMQNALNVVQIATPYDDTAFAGYAATGTAIVTGQAFERTNGGDVKYAAGYTIRLLPSTPYSNEYFVQIAAGKNIAGEGSFASGRFSADAVSVSAMHSHELTTTADGSGHFEFRNVPPGFYHVYVRIEWLAGGDTTGGLAYADVTVENGKTYNLIVTS